MLIHDHALARYHDFLINRAVHKTLVMGPIGALGAERYHHHLTNFGRPYTPPDSLFFGCLLHKSLRYLTSLR